MEDSLGITFARGVVWSGLGRYVNQIVHLAVSAVLARLLTPDDFGLIAMVLVFSGFLTTFSDAGLRSAVVQFRELDAHQISGLFWLGVLVGVSLFAMMVAASSLVAGFYQVPELRAVTAAMGSGMFFSALGVVPSGLLQRDLRFRSYALATVVASILSAGVALAAVFLGMSYWALVLNLVLGSALSSLFFFVFSGWWPRSLPTLTVFRDISGFAGGLSLYNGVNYWARNADNLLVGRFLGSAALGYYSRAYAVMLYPLSMLTSVIAPVLHSALSSIQDDVPRMRRAYLQVVQLIAMLCLPLMVILALMAREFVIALWGYQWEPSVAVFRVLCVVGTIQPVVSTQGVVFLARDRADMLLKTGFVSAAVVVAGIALGLPWGITGVAVGYSLSYALTVAPIMYIVLVRMLDGDVFDLLHIVLKAAGVSAVVGAIILLWNTLVSSTLAEPLHFLIGCGLALPVYIGAAYCVDRQFLVDVCVLIKRGVRNTVHGGKMGPIGRLLGGSEDAA